MLPSPLLSLPRTRSLPRWTRRAGRLGRLGHLALLLLAAAPVLAADGPEPLPHEGLRLALLAQRSAVSAGALARDGTDVVQRETRSEPAIELGWSWSVGTRGQLQLAMAWSPAGSALERPFGQGGRVHYAPQGGSGSLGARAGWRWGEASGRPLWAVFGVSEVKRRFEVTLTDAQGTIRQRDRQGHLRLEAGVEWAWQPQWRVRALLVHSRQDFGSRAVDLAGSHAAQGSLALIHVWD